MKDLNSVTIVAQKPPFGAKSRKKLEKNAKMW